MIDAISASPADDRLAGTLAIHLKAIEEGATIIRCHDVKEHKQAFEVAEALRNTTI
jgi:dihydropteroate synthase